MFDIITSVIGFNCIVLFPVSPFLSSTFLGFCISYLSCCCGQIPKKRQLTRHLFRATVQEDAIHSGKARQQADHGGRSWVALFYHSSVDQEAEWAGSGVKL